MERVNRIWRHPIFQEHYQNLLIEESNRIFCRHSLEHLLDVARLMYIRNLEEGAELPKHLIYGAALIHDIGRFIQNDKGIPHNEAGADIAEGILPECGYSEAESVLIAEAVREHRRGSDSTLGKYLYDADKQSRCCFSCDARKECNWPDEKKNLKITE